MDCHCEQNQGPKRKPANPQAREESGIHLSGYLPRVRVGHATQLLVAFSELPDEFGVDAAFDHGGQDSQICAHVFHVMVF